MKLKHNVKTQGIRPEIILAMVVADGVYRRRGIEMVVTSITDGKHSVNSLHYAGCAIDIRIRNLPDHVSLEEVVEEIREALTADFDVVLEKDHIHIEYQPKAS